MSRLSRKHSIATLKSSGNGIADLLDLAFMETWRINEKQYDYITQNATDQQLDALCSSLKTIGERRSGLMVINNLLLVINKIT